MRTLQLNGPRQAIDLYLASTRTPLLVFVHGGAWRTGDKSEFRAMGEYIAAHGLSVANVTYRLTTDDTPQVRHPDHINDVYAAIAYLVESADELGFLPRITLAGHSDGIYDIVSLLEEYPSYSYFCGPALQGSDYASVSSRSWKLRSDTPLYFIHSCDDELLSYAQTCEALKLTAGVESSAIVTVPRTSGGAALYAGSKECVADMYPSICVPDWVNVDFSATGTHDGMLQTHQLWDKLLAIADSST
ncbi:hypothetical protein MCUN1_001080 [Malassezia cuniculi]|uniref:BD-FAE-like domain-containing protein n=1 Tax=Malassezia cuniculi TaxID=948313 RepID=A0AAF0J5I4_9BASI|nr:hypothetical protein MCUN1_001080 [Malassezia cuniculi]